MNPNLITFNNKMNTYSIGVTEVFDAYITKYRRESINHVNNLKAKGWTNINDALLKALDLAPKKRKYVEKETVSMILFLSDGDPTVGETNVKQIVTNIHSKNTEKVPILSLGFGSEVDFSLLQRISSMTDSLSKMIYDGADAAVQLENLFYKVSRPTLSNVKLKYIGDVDQESLTKQKVGQMFRGGDTHETMGLLNCSGHVDLEVTADSKDGKVTSRTTLCEKIPDITSGYRAIPLQYQVKKITSISFLTHFTL